LYSFFLHKPLLRYTPPPLLGPKAFPRVFFSSPFLISRQQPFSFFSQTSGPLPRLESTLRPTLPYVQNFLCASFFSSRSHWFFPKHHVPLPSPHFDWFVILSSYFPSPPDPQRRPLSPSHYSFFLRGHLSRISPLSFFHRLPSFSILCWNLSVTHTMIFSCASSIFFLFLGKFSISQVLI